MWTLFDPLVKPVSAESKSQQILSIAAGKQGTYVPSTLERLWCLLEPTGPLSCRVAQSATKGN